MAEAAVAPTPDVGENLNNAFASLDALVEPSPETPAETQDQTPPETPEAPKEPQKATQDAPKEVPKDKVATKDDKTPEKPSSDEDVAPEKMAPKQLREAYNSLKKRYKELETTAKAKPQEDSELPKRLQSLQEERERIVKEREELLNKLKFKDYEQHPEYQEKYEKPFLSAYQEGREFVKNLEVIERKNDLDQVIQQGRKATEHDFDAVARLYAFNPAEGSKLANQLFGDMAPDVKMHVRESQRLFQAKEAAKADFRTKGSEMEKTYREQAEANAKAETDAFQKAFEYAPKQWPDRYGHKEGDTKGNELFDKATDIAVRAFTDGRPLKEGQKPLSGVELAQLRAAVVNQARAYPRERMWRVAAESRIKELETKLQKYQATEPTDGDTRKENGSAPVTFESVLDSMDKYVTP